MSNRCVLPGDPIPLLSSTLNTLGPGISVSLSRSKVDASALTSNYIATRAGILGYSRNKDKAQQLWVEGNSKRVCPSSILSLSSLWTFPQYIPVQKELVLGTIIARHAEGYRVELGTAQMATLDALAFEGATKRSKPNLKVRRWRLHNPLFYVRRLTEG